MANSKNTLLSSNGKIYTLAQSGTNKILSYSNKPAITIYGKGSEAIDPTKLKKKGRQKYKNQMLMNFDQK